MKLHWVRTGAVKCLRVKTKNTPICEPSNIKKKIGKFYCQKSYLKIKFFLHKNRFEQVI